MAPIPKSMSGILIEATGGPDQLHYKTDLPVPSLQDGEVLIRNEFIGVNYIDTYFRTGLYKSPLPFITGKEGAGTVLASRSPSFSEGDRVAYVSDKSYAEITAVPATKAVRLPAGVTTEQGAAALLQGLTALTFIREAAGIGASAHGVGEDTPWTLVHAAAGGTGSLMVQMLSAFGLRVIGTAGTDDKCARAKEHGAQWVINNKTEDVRARVMEITGGDGVDVIFDGVGKATFDLDLDVVARKGTLIVFGNASGPVDPVNILRLGAPGPASTTAQPTKPSWSVARNVKLLRPVLFGYIATPEEWDKYTKELFELIESGKVKLGVHNVYPLKDVAKAHEDLEGSKTTGKLLLKV
ncbi:hypothetical protein QBC39DRAFT_338273 [Podospora conica]|nr:hypothetical protein QBC39DRAFT_338273 [Schizothecium conicum]